MNKTKMKQNNQNQNASMKHDQYKYKMAWHPYGFVSGGFYTNVNIKPNITVGRARARDSFKCI